MSQESDNKLHTKYALHQIVLQQKTLAEFGRSEAGFLWHFSCGSSSCLLVDNSKYFLHLHIILYKIVMVNPGI